MYMLQPKLVKRPTLYAGIIHLPRAWKEQSANAYISMPRVSQSRVVCRPYDSATSAPALSLLNAPSPRSSGRRASETRAGSMGHGSRGRPSYAPSVSGAGSRGCGDGSSRACSDPATASRTAGATYPAMVKSGEVMDRVCAGGRGFGGCNGSNVG
jgi:hypothetical protein